MDQRVKGYFFVILSAILFGMYPIASKLAFAGGATPLNMLLLKGIGIVPLGTICLLRKTDMRLTKKEAGNIVILALLSATFTPLLLLNSYALIPAGTATTIHYSYCVITFLACVIIYKDPFDKLKGLCVVMCMLGVFLLYAPKDASSLPGMALALGSAFTFAFYAVYLEKSGMHAMDSFKLQFYTVTLSTLFVAAYTLIAGGIKMNISALGLGAALLYYMAGSTFAGVFFQLGIHRIGSQRAAILSTIEPITSVILGVILFSEKLSFRSGVGIVVILVAAVVITTVDGARKNAKPGAFGNAGEKDGAAPEKDR